MAAASAGVRSGATSSFELTTDVAVADDGDASSHNGMVARAAAAATVAARRCDILHREQEQDCSLTCCKLAAATEQVGDGEHRFDMQRPFVSLHVRSRCFKQRVVCACSRGRRASMQRCHFPPAPRCSSDQRQSATAHSAHLSHRSLVTAHLCTHFLSPLYRDGHAASLHSRARWSATWNGRSGCMGCAAADEAIACAFCSTSVLCQARGCHQYASANSDAASSASDATDPAAPYVMVLLNQPLGEFFKPLWENGQKYAAWMCFHTSSTLAHAEFCV